MANFGRRSRVVGWGDLGRSDGYRGGDGVWYPSVNHRKSGKTIGKAQENHSKTIGKPYRKMMVSHGILNGIYPLVICYITMENILRWEKLLNPVWQCSLAMFNYQKVNQLTTYIGLTLSEWIVNG